MDSEKEELKHTVVNGMEWLNNAGVAQVRSMTVYDLKELGHAILGHMADGKKPKEERVEQFMRNYANALLTVAAVAGFQKTAKMVDLEPRMTNMEEDLQGL